MLRGAIDIGGTFTDLVFINDETGEMTSYKTLTTPKDPSIGALNGVDESNVDLSEIWLLVHGTTIVINAIISHTGAKTGLITTQGFRDLLEIGRQNRAVSFDIFYKRPPPLVQRKWRLEVPERTDFLGNTVVELDLEEVKKAIESAGIVFEQASLAWIPQNLLEVEGGVVEKILRLLEALEDLDDVQKVYSNFDIQEEELARFIA